jgi:hypothetical protein
MTAPQAAARTAEVWGSTWIPGPSPVEGLGDDTGYSLAFVREHDGPMLQVFVDADHAPAPGATGEVMAKAIDDETIDVFTLAAGADA